MNFVKLGNTGFEIPQMVTGTSSLGNLYQSTSIREKVEVVQAAIQSSDTLPFFDTAGKYGAGLSLESLGNSLKHLGIDNKQVLISNKLGWKRTALKNGKPTFEREVWKDLSYDAIQKISYEGIMDCYEEGQVLLDGYDTQFASVHDPDEYLNQSDSKRDYEVRFDQILEGYSALQDLKDQKKIKAIGVGSKDWKVIRKIAGHVKLDWVMIANSMTLYHHPNELMDFLKRLSLEGIGIINSAVFQSGFLVGGDYFDYQLLNPNDKSTKEKILWRDKFFKICADTNVFPAHACIQFGLLTPGVHAVALNSSSPEKIKQNAHFCNQFLPLAFWEKLIDEKLIQETIVQLILNKIQA